MARCGQTSCARSDPQHPFDPLNPQSADPFVVDADLMLRKSNQHVRQRHFAFAGDRRRPLAAHVERRQWPTISKSSRYGTPSLPNGEFAVRDVEVQVRLGGVPRVADEPDDLSARHAIAQLDLERPRLEVRVERVVTAANVDDHVVAADRLQRDRHRTRVDARDILRECCPSPPRPFRSRRRARRCPRRDSSRS